MWIQRWRSCPPASSRRTRWRPEAVRRFGQHAAGGTGADDDVVERVCVGHGCHNGYSILASGKVQGQIERGLGAAGKSARLAAMEYGSRGAISPADLAILGELERKVLWLASWTIHNANHLRESVDGLKVGGHQASSASLATIMTALYFRALAAAGPRRGQAARLAELPCHPVSARQADPREARRLPRLQGRAVLSVAHQGRRRRRFLHRLGRPRRGADAVLVAGAGLRARPRLGHSTGPKAAWSR